MFYSDGTPEPESRTEQAEPYEDGPDNRAQVDDKEEVVLESPNAANVDRQATDLPYDDYRVRKRPRTIPAMRAKSFLHCSFLCLRLYSSSEPLYLLRGARFTK